MELRKLPSKQQESFSSRTGTKDRVKWEKGVNSEIKIPVQINPTHCDFTKLTFTSVSTSAVLLISYTT